MPKTRQLTPGARMNTILKSEIDRSMALNGIQHYGELGLLMGGRCSATAYNRMNNLGELRLCELRELVRRLKIRPEDLIPAIYDGK